MSWWSCGAVANVIYRADVSSFINVAVLHGFLSIILFELDGKCIGFSECYQLNSIPSIQNVKFY